jgi:hypothetical protein
MGQSFYYGTDYELSTGGLSFARLLVSDPDAYGVTAQQAQEIEGLALAYADAYKVAKNPSTRTVVTVADKRLRAAALTSAARRIGNMIIANPAVDDGRVVELGLKARVGRARIGRPETSPQVRVVGMHGHRFELEIRDPMRVGRGKPTGVAGAVVWIHTGDDAPAHEDWTLIASTTRTNAMIEIPRSVAPGTRLRICAAWFNNRQQRGEPGLITNAYVQFAETTPAEGGLRQAA